MQENDLAYTAGIIDGEGTIACYYNKSTKNTQQYIRVKMKYDKIPKWLHRKWGGSVNQMGDKQWNWKLSSIPATFLLKQMTPYLIEKKTQARIFIRLRYLKESHRGKDTPDLHEKKRKLIKHLKSLHN